MDSDSTALPVESSAGSDVHSSSAAMDKVLAKLIFREANLPLAKQVVIARQDDPASSPP